jgi:hypothetical protein
MCDHRQIEKDHTSFEQGEDVFDELKRTVAFEDSPMPGGSTAG